MSNMNNRSLSKEIAINNASFSLKMEGFSIDDECKALCEKLLSREISFDEYLDKIRKLQGLKI